MDGQVFTIAKLHYINGVVYLTADKETTDLDTLANNYQNTTKSGDVKHPLVRVRTLARFAEGLGLLDMSLDKTVTITDLGRQYYQLRADEKWSVSKYQAQLHRDYIWSDTKRTETIYSITTLFNLIKSGYTDDELTHRFAIEIGKEGAWKSDVTYKGFTEFGMNYLEELGMRVSNGGNDLPFPGLKPGQAINNTQLCEIFKCSTQGGMRRSLATNSLVIVSNHLKSVYEDRWIGNIFHYTGMGLKGEQSLVFAQNKTVNESQSNKIKMHLFEVFKDQEYQYQGEINLADKPYQETQPDDEGNVRKVWIFPLSLRNKETPFITQETLNAKIDATSKRAHKSSTSALKKKAKNAPTQPGVRNVLSKQYERNQDVAELVKRRANGICELCENEAPFITKGGEPYLESHHIIWLSREGSDSVENAVALCPNCHRRMHSLDTKQDRETLMIKAMAEIVSKE